MNKQFSKLEKFKHGSEISSEKLNMLIDTVNNIIESYLDINSIKKESIDNLTTITALSNKVSSELDTIPEVQNLLVDLLLCRDTVDWTDLNNPKTSVEDLIPDLFENTPNKIAERLNIIRGTTDEITLTTPALKDKQILIAFKPGSTSGYKNSPLAILYFDINYDGKLTRIPITTNGTVSLSSTALQPEFITIGDEVYLELISPNSKDPIISPNLVGPSGPRGVEGPKGETGNKGDPGETPYIGPNGTWMIGNIDTRVPATGDKGDTGRDLNVELLFSNDSYGQNFSKIYANHKYMGLRFYPKGADLKEIETKPVKWVRIMGETFYPKFDEKTKLLSFSTEYEGPFTPIKLEGARGPEGPAGPAPQINFISSTNNVTIEPLKTKGDIENGIYFYDADAFKGDKGDAPEISIGNITKVSPGTKPDVRIKSTDPGKVVLDFDLPQGEKGATPTIGFAVQWGDGAQPTIESLFNSNTLNDQDFLLKIPKAKDGTPGKDGAYITDTFIEADTGNLKVILSDGTLITAGRVKGEKGDQGIPGTPGQNGKDGQAFTIKGSVPNSSLLPITGNPGEAYFVGEVISEQEMYYWDSTNGNWATAGKLRGAPGVTPTFKIGTITSVSPTSNPKVTINQNTDTHEVTLNFEIPKGEQGSQGSSIESILPEQIDENTTKYTIKLTNNDTKFFTIKNGKDGIDGKGIYNISKTGSRGLEDYYSIRYTDNTEHTFVVKNGTTHTVKFNANEDLSIISPDQNPYVELQESISDATGEVNHIFKFALPEATRIIKATRDPDNTLTEDLNIKHGHFWLNMLTGTLFYKENKTTNPWDTANSLQLKGSDGHSIRYGEIDPRTNNGIEGNSNDLYLDVKTGNLYKKTGNADTNWTDLDISVLGKPGDKGEPGERGTGIFVYDQLPTGEGLKNLKTGDVIIKQDRIHTYQPGLGAFPWIEGPILKGNGIEKIEKANSNGLIDTYKISYTDGNYSEFQIINGKDAIAPEFSQTPKVTTTAPGTNAKVILTPTTSNGLTTYNIEFEIPKGDKGDPGDDFKLEIKGELASVENLDDQNPEIGDAFIIKPNGEAGEQLLYVSINPNGATFNDRWYKGGNIKGAQGNCPEIIIDEKIAITDPEDDGRIDWSKVDSSSNINKYLMKLSLPRGYKGDPGDTPTIGSNGNWWVSGADTRVAATGPVGATPDLSDVSVTPLSVDENPTFQIITTGDYTVKKPKVLIGLPKAERGHHFTPSVSASGVLSWTLDGDLTPPQSINITGPRGYYYKPSVDSNTGDITWTLGNGDATLPSSANIKGPKGDPGFELTWDSLTKTLTIAPK